VTANPEVACPVGHFVVATSFSGPNIDVETPEWREGSVSAARRKGAFLGIPRIGHHAGGHDVRAA
jgi:hypothetical protein